MRLKPRTTFLNILALYQLKRASAINGGDILAKVTGCAVVGLEGAIVEVEVDISSGLPSFVNVGVQC
jgi:hypothetical protein